MASLWALTGGIASGKSTVLKRFQELGAATVSADRLTVQLQQPGGAAYAPMLEYFRERLGVDVLRTDGTLNRSLVGQLIFGDSAVTRRTRKSLETLIHPLVKAEAQRLIANFQQENPQRAVVYEIPLLSRAEAARYDLVILTVAPYKVRLNRLIEQRSLEPEEARKRLRSQMSSHHQRRIAHRIIRTGGSLRATHQQVDALMASVAEKEKVTGKHS